jgi:hypothetical protein
MTKRRKATKGNGTDRLSPEWRKIITALRRYKKGFARADVEAVAKRNGKSLQMARFVEAGIFQRMERGMYRVAKPGRASK